MRYTKIIMKKYHQWKNISVPCHFTCEVETQMSVTHQEKSKRKMETTHFRNKQKNDEMINSMAEHHLSNDIEVIFALVWENEDFFASTCLSF